MTSLAAGLDQHRGPRAYFADPYGTEMLGLGVSRLVKKDPCTVAEALRPPDDGPWVFAVRFDPERAASPTWAPFGAALWWRPARWRDREGEREFAPADIRFQASADVETTDPSRWDRGFGAALEGLGRGTMDKVVLARPFDRPRPRRPLGPALDAAGPDSFRFGLFLDDDLGFVGQSPELLLRREEDGLFSEALAGTRPRADQQGLLDDDKETREHQLVVDAICAALAPRNQAGAPLVVEGPVLRPHGDVVHLATSVFAPGRGDPWTVAARLMPTPAVCGTPREVARDFIRQHEGFDRGLYAGVVGVVDGDRVVMTVALRSMLLTANTARVFAGGGLVAGSRREAERREIEHKAAPWLRWCDER